MCTPDGHRIDIDLTDRAPLRLGIADGQHVWLHTPGDLTRVRASDLRRLAREVAAVRVEYPGRDVVADIHVVIADEAQAARAALAEAGKSPPVDTLFYVGTASGLAGLVADLYALGITDGAMLIPLLGSGVVEFLRREVLPELQTLLPAGPRSSQPRPA
ncbi:hypothetical protein B8W69_00205 [Mycobacterium vulneris]|jgi:hypothetical protein|uniref:Uncharacterized protein n=1 Tax=Mycolicibacterium vulneris TaxID=547163 RepID=A0A1X2LE78_9MYCO|nr:hypothetical protein [Mycolicibacterium vulneris]OSC32266.1 hypothetical protein B8W69_00205 [Mycolicibacterium vulneris]